MSQINWTKEPFQAPFETNLQFPPFCDTMEIEFRKAAEVKIISANAKDMMSRLFESS